MMELKHVGGIFVGRGMSRAFQRAKERENRTPDELVMDKTKISRSLELQVSDVRKRTDVQSSDVQSGSEIRKFYFVGWFRSSRKLRTSGRSGGSERP